MKYRSTFVSNSSTCSFVMMGFLVSEEDFNNKVLPALSGKTIDDINNEYDLYDFKYTYCCKSSSPGDLCFFEDEHSHEYLVGILIGSWSSDSWDTRYSEAPVIRSIETIQRFAETIFPDFQVDSISVVSDTYSC